MFALIKFSISNLKRSRSRFIFSLLAVMLGVMLITTLFILVDSLRTSVNDSLDFLEGTLIVQEKGLPDPSLSRISVSIMDDLREANQSTLKGMLKGISARVSILERDNSTSLGVKHVIGVDPADERRTTNIMAEENFLIGRPLGEKDKNKIVIGVLAATVLKLGINDQIDVKNETFTVVGIFETDSLIDAVMYIPLQDAMRVQNLTNTVSTIFVSPKSLDNLDEVKEFVNTVLFEKYGVEAIEFNELAASGLQILELMNQFGIIVGFLTMVVATLSVVNTILMGVQERRREIAVLKATGWTNREIATEVIIESMVITVAGGILGIILGVLISKLSLDYFGTLLRFSFSFSAVLNASLVTISLGFFAGLYPAVRATRISPVVDLAR